MLTVLIAEDSSSMQKRLLSMLSPIGEGHLARDGQEDVDMLKKRQVTEQGYDLLIMDIIMPRKDGYTAAREIRDFERSSEAGVRKKVKIIFITTVRGPG